MLIGNVLMSEKGIKVYDVDGSHIELKAMDAIDLAAWIMQKRESLLEIVRREQKTKEEAKKEEQHG